MGKPFIKLLHTINAGYFYDVNRNQIVDVSEESYQYLQDLLADKSVGEELEEITYLRESGYLKPSQVMQIRHPMTSYTQDLLDQNIDLITLQVTQDCNFRCEYCIYSDTDSNIGQRQHSKKMMSLETAKQAIRFLRDHSAKSKTLNIGFYGGEPLLQFSLIKKIVEYAEEELFGKEITYAITTNGSLLKGEILDFLQKYQVAVNLSFDGPKEIQDNNRRFAHSNASTYELVYDNLKEAFKKYPDYAKRFSIHSVLIPSYDFDQMDAFFKMPLIKDLLCNNSMVDDHYSSKKHTKSAQFHEKSQYHNFLAYLYSLDRLERNGISRVVREPVLHSIHKAEDVLKGSNIPIIGSPSGQCVPGLHRLFCDVDGNLYPCERVSETAECMRIGTLDDGFDLSKVNCLLNVSGITAEQCKQCEAFLFCGICISSCEKNGKLSANQRLSHCDIIRAETESCLQYAVLKQEYKQCYKE